MLDEKEYNDLLFKQGIARLSNGLEKYSIALMCAEKDPITCHRMILVSRELRSVVDQINHILSNGNIETNEEAEDRLLNMFRIVPEMFKDRSKCVEEAYDKQGQKIAYTKEEKHVMVN